MSRQSTHIVRVAQPQDADGIAEIYAPIVRDTPISFELVPPGADQMRTRLQETLRMYPWLVSVNEAGEVSGYAYASKHRTRAAYQWSVDTSAYVRADASWLLSGVCRHCSSQSGEHCASRKRGIRADRNLSSGRFQTRQVARRRLVAEIAASPSAPREPIPFCAE
jgi:hypothetical protein